jgi:hypothetical protein
MDEAFSSEVLGLKDNGGRRSGFVRRTFSYTAHIPERRSGDDRRSGNDRRRPVEIAESLSRDAAMERRAALGLLRSFVPGIQKQGP